MLVDQFCPSGYYARALRLPLCESATILECSKSSFVRIMTRNAQPLVPRTLAILLLTSTPFMFSSFAVYNIAFESARSALLPLLLRVPLVWSFLKPFTGHFFRGPWTLTLPLRHFSLESHAFTLGLSMLARWEFAESLIDVYIPQVRHHFPYPFMHQKLR